MTPLRIPRVRSLLSGSLLLAFSACGNEPVKHPEELPKGRIPHMSKQQIENSKKPQNKPGAKRQPASSNG